MTGMLISQYVSTPSLISYKDQRYLIMDAPTDANLDQYLKELKKHNVTSLELPFPDGAPPPSDVVSKWLNIIDEVFEKKGEKATIAIHCVAGLGRAPVCVAIGLIEKGMDPMDAIQMIRNKRRGAINRKQVKFLMDYRRRSPQSCCIVC